MVRLNIIEKPNKFLSNILLFSFSFLFIFFVPVFPSEWHGIINDILFSLLYFTGIYALDHVRKEILTIGIVAFIAQWVARIFDMPVLEFVSNIINILFFQIIVIRLIMQVAGSKKVNTNVIFESINGYLLMGIVFASWVAILVNFIPEAFSGFIFLDVKIQEIIYFTFVTMTTLGYGEITPQIPVAKSLSILISTTGQLYIAIIIAMLVGKFAGSKNE